MRERVLDFVGTLRAHGVRVSVAEAMDAMSAVVAAGVDRPVMRDALAATLVKDERDRSLFDRLFDAAFPLVGADADRPGRRRRGARGSPGTEGRGSGTGDGTTGTGARAVPSRSTEAVVSPPTPSSRRGPYRGEGRPPDDRVDEASGSGDRRRSPAHRARELMELPFAEFTGRDVVEARELVRELGARLRGRLARRERDARRGRVDLRRTLGAARASGGVPMRLRRRGRRPGRPDLLALCDLSGSVAGASELLLGLVAPAERYFRRVHTFAYVDRLCPVSLEDGHVAPDGRLDLHARSDFGRVLGDLWPDRVGILGRSTVMLVLGDARNNRRPPRADLLRHVRERVDRLVWLVPEPVARWNTGDSVLGRYAPLCDAVVECGDLHALVAAVRRAL